MAHTLTTHALGWAAMPIRFHSKRPMAHACDGDTSTLSRLRLQDQFCQALRGAIRVAAVRPIAGDPFLSCTYIHKLLPTTLPHQVLDYLVLFSLQLVDAPWNAEHYTKGGALRIRLSDGRTLSLRRDTLHSLFAQLQSPGPRRLLERSCEGINAPHGQAFSDDGYCADSPEAAADLLHWLNTSFHFNSHLFVVDPDSDHPGADRETVPELLSPAPFTPYEPAAKTRFLSPRPPGQSARRRGLNNLLVPFADAAYYDEMQNKRFIRDLTAESKVF